jgi:death-on-curing protein
MSEPVWIIKSALLRLHDAQLAEHGGIRGVNEDLLESALNCARQKFYYSDTTLPLLAAAYGFGLCRNHPFKDGNKRAALIAMRLFLMANSYDIAVDKAEKYQTIMRLADGEMSEEQLGEWIVAHMVARG